MVSWIRPLTARRFVEWLTADQSDLDLAGVAKRVERVGDEDRGPHSVHRNQPLQFPIAGRTWRVRSSGG
jgi:hypothetical protein